MDKELDDYMNKSQLLLSKDKNALLTFINEQKNKWNSHPQLLELLKGESAFYNDNYEHALKHYLQAKDIPDHDFFCYRASAFVSRRNHQLDKAITFAQKALKPGLCEKLQPQVILRA